MKILFTILLVLFSAISAFSLETPWDQKLPFKDATIYYTTTGTMNGTKTIFIKDYGQTRAEYSETAVMGQPIKEATITTPDWVYSIDYINMAGSKQANPNKYIIQEFRKLPAKQQQTIVSNLEKMGISTVQGLHGSVEKNAAQILGYQCDKISIQGSTVFTISDTQVPLKTVSSMMGVNVKEIATQIKKGVVNSSKFQVPKNIYIEHNREVDQLLQSQAKSTIQNLLTGKGPEMPAIPTNKSSTGNSDHSTDLEDQLKGMLQLFGQ